MTRRLVYIVCLVASSPPLAAQQSVSKPAETMRMVQLTVRPAAEPRPALTYHLLPDLLDQTVGNAAVLYLDACGALPAEYLTGSEEKVSHWRDTPLKDLPRNEVRRVLDECGTALRQLELAAFRESCQWDLPIRSEGFNLQLPSLSRLRSLARLVSVRIRLNLAEGNRDAVLHDLQVGFSMARHVAEGPTLIHALVGVAIAAVMTDCVEELIQTSDCPNLYWALSGLPRPFINLRPALEYERSALVFNFPQLRDPRKATLTLQQWQDLLRILGISYGWQERLEITAVAAKIYPQAKRYLLSQDYTPEQVDAMPVLQVLAIHAMDRSNYWKDEVYKWFDLPYWQVWERMRETEAALNEAIAQGDGQPFIQFLPAIGKAYASTTAFDRRIAALQCIEAIRLHAASHDGKLPASLGQIREVPIPADPITGQEFRYQFVGEQGVLEWAPPPGLSTKYAGRYELTLAR